MSKLVINRLSLCLQNLIIHKHTEANIKHTNKESNMKSSYLFFTAFLALTSCALAFDPSPLQDFCVAINDTKNGGMYNMILFLKFITVNQFNHSYLICSVC